MNKSGVALKSERRKRGENGGKLLFKALKILVSLFCVKKNYFVLIGKKSKVNIYVRVVLQQIKKTKKSVTSF